MPPWSARKDGVSVLVRLTPKSAREAIDGIDHLSDGRAVLKFRVRALPEAGAANEALVRLVAKTLALPASSITLESGASGRLKCLRLRGDASLLIARLEALAPRMKET
jgi:uncharacterized protein YggU (UPF0235/DUF167 family)